MVDDVVAVFLLAQAPRLRAMAATAMIARYFMFLISPPFFAKGHGAGMFCISGDKTTFFRRPDLYAGSAAYGCIATGVSTATRL